MSETTEYVRTVIKGNGGVGKTSIAWRITSDTFESVYDPTIEDQYRIHRTIDNIPVIVEIHDEAGPEEYASLRDRVIVENEVFVVVYDVTERRSFEALQSYVDNILRVKDVEYAPIVIVGNQIDRVDDRAVSTSEGQNYASDISASFLETSAKTGENVQEVLQELVRIWRKWKVNPRGSLVDLSHPRSKKKCTLM